MKSQGFVRRLFLTIGIALTIFLIFYFFRPTPTPIAQITSSTGPRTVLPKIIERKPLSVDRSTWKTYILNTFEFRYPSRWYATGDPGTIQNWNPKTTTPRGGPLGSDMAKWDFSFLVEPDLFSDIQTIVSSRYSEEGVVIDRIEKVTTESNLEIYFVTGKYPSFGGVLESFVTAIYVSPNRTYFIWGGLPQEKYLQILEQIAESVKPNK